MTVDAGDYIVEKIAGFDEQAGTPPDLLMIWNDLPAKLDEIDVVLHLHGYSQSAVLMNIATSKRPISGLDFGDPDRPPGATPIRDRPTLALLPRGRYFGGRTGCGYDFPLLMTAPGWPDLKRAAMSAFKARTGLPWVPRIGRRILTAHSGGGAGLAQLSGHFDPHEIHVFDALYSPAPILAAWVKAAIHGDAKALAASPRMSVAAYMAQWGRALRVFYIAGSGTEAASLELAAAIDEALQAAGSAGDVLKPWYQVEAVNIEHTLIPRRLGWLLLADGGAGIA